MLKPRGRVILTISDNVNKEKPSSDIKCLSPKHKTWGLSDSAMYLAEPNVKISASCWLLNVNASGIPMFPGLLT